MDDQKTDAWSIDADASLQSVVDDPKCSPPLRQTLTGVLSWQTRNETPVRKALASPRIAPQWMATLLALGATVIVEEGGGGSQEVPLAEAEIANIRALLVRTESLRWGEAHVARTPADEPIVAAIATVKMDGPSAGSGQSDVVQEARVALTGVWPEPVRLAGAPTQLIGGPLDEARIQAVAQAVQEEVEPREDFRGSVAYRRAMAGVLTRRALEACLRQGVEDE
jgi:carbon-monoxide dehydrogenase medium subunit